MLLSKAEAYQIWDEPKKLYETNTLAYFVAASMTKKKKSSDTCPSSSPSSLSLLTSGALRPARL